ncbi:MAG TPA: TIM-barrel domain-containing protein [Acidobacteriaceae bacterium]|nr:TIM-barrel domain-containing protein [Acidobacteriaceae bacterium]
MTRVLLIAGLLVAGLVSAVAQPSGRSSTVVDGNARFTVITPTLIRLEYSSDGKFIDRRSYFAWERDLMPPQFTVNRAAGRLSITTSRMKMSWAGGTHGFDATSLSIAFRNEDGSWQTWHPGDPQRANLGGTLENLDGASGAEPLPDGVVSRDGWFLYRDDTFLLSDGPHPWIRPRPTDEIDDWYFFGYGQDGYPTALKDLTAISGRIPLPPRFMLGSWRSRYFSYTQDQFQQLALAYDAHRFPLDVLVMDMGWHTTPHWGALDWNRQLIPHPTAMLHWLHDRQLHVTLNWHPNDGVGPWYSQYEELCRALGINPASQKVIPFEDTNEKFMRNYYKLLMDPLEKQGVDFWWLDGGIHLGWDNALDFWNIGRPETGRRGASFSRWGGWGDQRYPVWFSGDTSSLWRTLRFEVPFTATAGNVGADYWSNDISGFRLKIPNSELFTRWVEFGALSPVFRTHGESEFGNYRIPWDDGDRAEAASRRAYDLRDQLFPYIYSSAYLTWTTSLPLSRPLYLDYPTDQQAYTHPEEYEFGPDLLVAPIVTRGMGRAWLGATDMWFPAGTWWNLLSGERVNDPGNRTVLATADQIPVFARGGVPLPMQKVTPRMAARPANPLVVKVYPGPDGAFTMYEDDGISPACLHGTYALTPLRYRNVGTDDVSIAVGPTEGSYAGQPESRQIVVQLAVTAHPAAVTADGSQVPESSAAVPGYTYDPATATTEVRLPEGPIRKQVRVNVKFLGSEGVRAMIPRIVNQIAVVERALAGAGEVRAGWKFALQAELFHLQTLLSRAEQEFGPASSQEVQAGLQSAEKEQSTIQSGLQEYTNMQARAAAFALADAWVNASVRLRKVDEGLVAEDVPRYHEPYDRPTDISGYNTGLLLRVLTPSDATRASLDVQVPGLGDKHFTLPQGRRLSWAYLPFMKATQHPIYHLRGTATLSMTAINSQRVLIRDIDLRSELLDEWNLLGPFAQGNAPEIGKVPVTAATLRQSYTGRNGKPLSWETWQAATRDQDYERGNDYLQTMKPWIDLYTIYPTDHASAVAVTWVEAPTAVSAKLRVRHNAGIAVWVNQHAVMDSEVAKGITDLRDPPPDETNVDLKEGWNEIAIRTDDGSRDWGFSLRLALPAGVICAESDMPPAKGGIGAP